MVYDSNLMRFFILSIVVPEMVTLVCIFRRHLLRDTAWFAIYLGFDMVTSFILFPLYQSTDKWDFFVASWISGLILVALAFMVIVEVFRDTVAEFGKIRRTGLFLLYAAGMVLVIFTFLISPYGIAYRHASLGSLVILLRSARIIQVGLVLYLFAFSSYLGISWKHYRFGTALGFGFYASVSLASVAYTSEVPAAAYKEMVVDGSAYLVAVVIWMIYFLKQEPKVQPFPLAKGTRDLERWDRALSDLTGKDR